jgi:hypothetical protein
MSIGDEGATADSKEVLAAMMTADQKLHFDLLVHAGDIRYSTQYTIDQSGGRSV